MAGVVGQTPIIKVRTLTHSQAQTSVLKAIGVETGQILWGGRHDEHDVAARKPRFKRE